MPAIAQTASAYDASLPAMAPADASPRAGQTSTQHRRMPSTRPRVMPVIPLTMMKRPAPGKKSSTPADSVVAAPPSTVPGQGPASLQPSPPAHEEEPSTSEQGVPDAADGTPEIPKRLPAVAPSPGSSSTSFQSPKLTPPRTSKRPCPCCRGARVA